MKRWVTAVVLAAYTPLLTASQAGNPQGDFSVLTGSIVADADGSPLVGVHVTVRMTPDAHAPVTLTDTFGRFQLPVIAARRYQLVARKAGYESISVAASLDSPISVRLPGGSVVTGRVSDDDGEPVVGAQVSLLSPDGSTVRTTATDDRGEYRLSVQPARPTLVAATTQGLESAARTERGLVISRTPEHRTFFPDADTFEQAQAIVLQPGQLRSGVDFAVRTLQSARQPQSAFESLPVLGMLMPERDGTGDPTGVVAGRVMDQAGRALANALVVLTNERGGSGTRLVRSDAAGLFEFHEVAPGSTRVAASKPGYAAADSRPIIGTAESQPTQVTLRLTSWASIEGRVVDELGEPVQGVRVQVLRTSYGLGRRQFVPASNVEPLTDDRGQYRVFGLEPGTYVVSARPDAVESIGLAGYAPSYYSGAGASSEVQILRLSAGTSMVGIDVPLMRTPMYRITGRIVTASGQAWTWGAPQLWPSQNGRAAVLSAPIRADIWPDGRFAFSNVTDGQYVLQAYRGRSNSMTEGEFGAVTVSVNGADVNELVLLTSSGSNISGTIVFESSDPAREPARSQLELTPIPSDVDLAPSGNWATAGVGPDWTFSMAGISGARRIVPTRLPNGWALKEVRVNGIDVSDSPMPFGAARQSLSDVQIVLTDRITRLTGKVSTASGEGIRDMPLAVFSSERDHWYPSSRYLRRVTTRTEGTFAVEGLPPGNYYVAMLTSTGDSDNAWQDPGELEALISRASFVALTEGQGAAIQLRR